MYLKYSFNKDKFQLRHLFILKIYFYIFYMIVVLLINNNNLNLSLDYLLHNQIKHLKILFSFFYTFLFNFIIIRILTFLKKNYFLYFIIFV